MPVDLSGWEWMVASMCRLTSAMCSSSPSSQPRMLAIEAIELVDKPGRADGGGADVGQVPLCGEQPFLLVAPGCGGLRTAPAAADKGMDLPGTAWPASAWVCVRLRLVLRGQQAATVKT
ncbi:hypothetical protein [Actinoplanes sp. NPDC049599]|uniref:hypothetical protein n=1 Tax=Actinoplanes sp. NPDC049599 TaxID=3363903 RepID=UPI00379A3C15